MQLHESWMAAGTGEVERAVACAAEGGGLQNPSLLPGWTQAHVATHLARNADGLVNLLSWARTGIETPMYVSWQRRNEDIDMGAERPADAIVADLLQADRRLGEAIAAMPDAAWAARITTPSDRVIDAPGVVWMRVRELWFHLVDLGEATTFADVPTDLTQALLSDLAGEFHGRDDCDPIRLCPDGGGTFDVGRPAAGAEHPAEVRGSTAALLAWLSGRDAGGALTAPGGQLPARPAWR